MAFNDLYRLSAHAVICNDANEILQLKANYGDNRWGLPGGALEPGETIHEALERECLEELGANIVISYLSGFYYHSKFNSQVFIFRAQLEPCATIRLSSEHSAYHYFPLDDLSDIQQLP